MACFRIRRQSPPATSSNLGNILGLKNVAMKTVAGSRQSRHLTGQVVDGVNHTVV